MINFKLTIFQQRLMLFALGGLILLMPAAVMAVGVSATPSKLQIKAAVNQTAAAEVLVKNPSNKVGIFDVYADDFEDWIKAAPASFTLEAGESKKVEIVVKSSKIGQIATNISIVAKPLSSNDFQANSGIKIPFNIMIVEAADARVRITPKLAFTLLNFILVCLVAMVYWRNPAKRSEQKKT